MTDKSGSGVRLEKGTHIDWIVLDRPGAANAFSSEMLEAFSAALADLATQGAPVVGIRSGGKGFGSGVDLGEYNAAAIASGWLHKWPLSLTS